ncbi:MAG: Na+/H+ antiporter NhaA [Hyphomicrobium sp.]
MPIDALRDFFRQEAAGGIVLVLASAIAVVAANSPASPLYAMLLETGIEIRIGALEIAKPLLLWINDGLMAVFFFLVGLEIKREVKEGELSTPAQAILPAMAAVGGMAVPALIYVAVNLDQAENLNGWAIPAATDIAFALGVLALLGNRVPLSMKVLLTAIAIYDDLGAIVIIAIFYTEQLSFVSIVLALGALGVLVALNLFRVWNLALYVIIGIMMWVFVLKSGVHATLAGVALALTIPMQARDPNKPSPLKRLEHDLHPWVAFFILPIFGFANAGVSFASIGLYSFTKPVTLGIAAGLFLGKQIGIFGCIWLMVRLKLTRMPLGATWTHIYGVALLCGIGFTMSLFIGSLAWQHTNFDAAVRLGVITGSILSAFAGFMVIRFGASERSVLSAKVMEDRFSVRTKGKR